MDKITFDTNAFESNKPLRFPNKQIFVSAIVLMELMTAGNDTKELKSYQKVWKDAKNNEILIVPNEQDIVDAGRIQFFLAQERKKDAGGKSPKRTAKVKQEIALDCMIAVSCARENITVITNDGDFREIGRYLKKLKLLKF